ncbi:MAG: hypothetical protein MUC62_08615 [Candidatus Thermoplasmatota archaeon]|nr:hypothetical protein [Candidatus Thermoplasmatota archaeon]
MDHVRSRMADNRSSALKQFRQLALDRYKWVTYVVSALVVLSVTVIVFRAEATENKDIMNRSDDIQRIIDNFGGTPKVDPKVIAKYVDTSEEISKDGDLDAGGADTITIPASTQKVVTSISAKLSWTDETNPPGFRIRRYQNQPDTFSMKVQTSNGTLMDQGSSESGSLDVGRDLKEDEVLTLFGSGNFSVVVQMDDAGDWEPRLGPGIPITDPGNTYSIVITVGYKVDPKTL